MDVCLVAGNNSLTWAGAWQVCFDAGARLLELPNSTYNASYSALISPIFSPKFDYRWLGFTTSNATNGTIIRQWNHGNIHEDMSWNPTVTTVVGSISPFCGRAMKVPSRTTWSEESCSSGNNRSYFCQFLLEEGNRKEFLMLQCTCHICILSIYCSLRLNQHIGTSIDCCFSTRFGTL